MLNGDASMQMLQGSRFNKYQFDSANNYTVHNKEDIFTKRWYRI